jgi:ribonuclease D
LIRLAERLRGERSIAIDTETNALHAYRERLCLVQLSVPERDFIVDPLALADLSPLGVLLADPAIEKVLHDAEYDVLTLRRLQPFELRGLFDTKVAAAALGLPGLGLQALLADLLDVRIDKRLQCSDWGARPLSRGQLEYARGDTRHLLALADRLRAELERAPALCRLEFAAECRRLESVVPEPRRFDPEEFWRIRGCERLDPVQRRALRELFVARHRIADRDDVPAFKVLGNDVLLALARALPADETALLETPGVPHKLALRWRNTILHALSRAKKLAPIPGPPPRNGDGVAELDATARGAYEALRRWRKKTADARRTDPSLVLPRPLMLRLAQPPRPQSLEELARGGLLEEWQLEHYGAAIVAALQTGGRRRGRRG